MDDVASWPLQKRLEEVIKRALPKVGPDVREQLAAMISPTSLAIMAGVLIAWVGSHAFGLGEIIDIVIAVGGMACIGLAVFSGLDELYGFATATNGARTAQDLDIAADCLAKAIAILGVQVVLAVLFRGRPKTYKGGRIDVSAIDPPPTPTPGWRYRPTTTLIPSLPAGKGSTSPWGDIVVSIQGSTKEQALALLHERVHQFLRPKLYVLRNFRVEHWAQSYFRSSLWRYLEEALAETIAQVGVNGLLNSFEGIAFPVRNGYVYLWRSGGYKPLMAGSGVIPEGAGLLATGAMAGITFQLWLNPQPAPAKSQIIVPAFGHRR